ncbi:MULTISPECIES: hypothetical protein [unclassified Streptomyces]|nr:MULTISPECIES: hypothetical protein [unclassified Streptomyces]MDH6451304.1 hypothetical protein [Streptomyces sp. SAI-119]MDH6498137.1 hypothetical protein [Streptomyces sp. SAI-149]
MSYPSAVPTGARELVERVDEEDRAEGHLGGVAGSGLDDHLP